MFGFCHICQLFNGDRFLTGCVLGLVSGATVTVQPSRAVAQDGCVGTGVVLGGGGGAALQAVPVALVFLAAHPQRLQ